MVVRAVVVSVRSPILPVSTNDTGFVYVELEGLARDNMVTPIDFEAFLEKDRSRYAYR